MWLLLCLVNEYSWTNTSWPLLSALLIESDIEVESKSKGTLRDTYIKFDSHLITYIWCGDECMVRNLNSRLYGLLKTLDPRKNVKHIHKNLDLEVTCMCWTRSSLLTLLVYFSSINSL